MMAALEHGLLHCIRFAHAKQTNLIYDTDTGRSGVIGCFLLLPIVLPMKFEILKTKVRETEQRVYHICGSVHRDDIMAMVISSPVLCETPPP